MVSCAVGLDASRTTLLLISYLHQLAAAVALAAHRGPGGPATRCVGRNAVSRTFDSDSPDDIERRPCRVQTKHRPANTDCPQVRAWSELNVRSRLPTLMTGVLRLLQITKLGANKPPLTSSTVVVVVVVAAFADALALTCRHQSKLKWTAAGEDWQRPKFNTMGSVISHVPALVARRLLSVRLEQLQQ